MPQMPHMGILILMTHNIMTHLPHNPPGRGYEVRQMMSGI